MSSLGYRTFDMAELYTGLEDYSFSRSVDIKKYRKYRGDFMI